MCEGSAAVSEFPVKVDDGRRAAMASEMMIDLLDSCVEVLRGSRGTAGVSHSDDVPGHVVDA